MHHEKSQFHILGLRYDHFEPINSMSELSDSSLAPRYLEWK